MSEYRIVNRSIAGDDCDEWLDRFNPDQSWYTVSTRAAMMYRQGYVGVRVEKTDDGETWEEVDGWLHDSAGARLSPTPLRNGR